MSLKDAYLQGSTGLANQLKLAHDAGVALVGAAAGQGQFDAITTGLQNNAAKGLTKFTVSIPVTYNPASLRGNSGDNLILKSLLSGVVEALSVQLIYDYECTPTLNTADTVNTYIDLNFTF